MKDEKTDLTSQVIGIIEQYSWPRKHKSAILVLVQRICDMEKQRRSHICIENLAIDEIGGELLGSLKYLLNDK